MSSLPQGPPTHRPQARCRRGSRALRLTIGYVLGTLALLWFFNQARDLLGLALLAALFSLSLESHRTSLIRLPRRAYGQARPRGGTRGGGEEAR
jgi:hypothetical protein